MFKTKPKQNLRREGGMNPLKGKHRIWGLIRQGSNRGFTSGDNNVFDKVSGVFSIPASIRDLWLVTELELS